MTEGLRQFNNQIYEAIHNNELEKAHELRADLIKLKEAGLLEGVDPIALFFGAAFVEGGEKWVS